MPLCFASRGNMEYFAYIVIYSIVFLLGSCLGSFLNVVIYRLPRGLPFGNDRSRCPGCGTQIKPYDMIPVLSYFILRARCRACGSKISARYPAVEALCGALGVICALVLGPVWAALAVFAALLMLLAVALIDWDTMEIPNALVIALAVPAVALAFLQPEIGLPARGIGVLTLSLPMLAMNLIVRDSFGGGDIKLMAVCGFMLGWQLTLVAGFAALLTGGCYGVYLLKSGKKGRRDHFAFGPFLAFGVALALLAGQPILSWYLGLFMA